MITEHVHSENNDWQESGQEHLVGSGVSTPPAMDATAQEEGQKKEEGAQSKELPVKVEEEGAVVASSGEQTARVKEALVTPVFAEQELPADQLTMVDVALTLSGVTEEVVTVAGDGQQLRAREDVAPTLFPVEVETPLLVEGAVRPFTDFIEEFRQIEGDFGPLLNEPENSFTPFVAGSESVHEPVAFLETAPEDLVRVVDIAPLNPGLVEQVEQIKANNELDSALMGKSEEMLPGLTQPRLSPERPVSPLLRPAARPRLPRHGRHRIDELIHPAELRGDMPKTSTPAPVEGPANTSEPPVEPGPEDSPARPARRYRFDRPVATSTATKTPAPVRETASKEKRGLTTQGENGASAEPVSASTVASVSISETPAPKASAQEAPQAAVETPAPTAPQTERRRRGSHERTREKEQQAAAPVAVPVPEPVVPAPEAAPPVVAPEVPVEELPPLEYSELQAVSSRRRRRRRAGSASAAVSSANGLVAPKTNLPDLAGPSLPALPTPPAPAPVAPKSVPPTPPAYNIVSGYTISQMNQGNDVSGPFMGPEPSPARGSSFSSTPVRHVRNEALRGTSAHAVRHGESQMMSGVAVNHLATVVSQAMQTQTDRMVAELRRANQVPTNVSVTLPPFPSTERVGVFVDVANLLYSARTLRMTVDFGKLLDFLRGNRRLVRAQAYCPTSPQPGEDQMFLQAVKGLGYRITTKNYKTFSSGAKKADLDLDLCMDVVRLVDGKAVDCIVLVSGDSDFMPMLDYCSDHGVRVEVAAFDESMSATLRQSCDLFVNLSMLEEIRS